MSTPNALTITLPNLVGLYNLRNGGHGTSALDEQIAAREQFLAYIMTAAIEGGVNYWASVLRWEHSDGPAKTEAVISDAEEVAVWTAEYLERNKAKPTPDAALAAGAAYLVTPTIIEAGIARACDPTVSLNNTLRSCILLATVTSDAGHIDADAADVLVQLALFGSVVYG